MDRREQRVLREIRRDWRRWPELARCVHGRDLRRSLRQLAFRHLSAVEFLAKLGDVEGLRAVGARILERADVSKLLDSDRMLACVIGNTPEPIYLDALRASSDSVRDQVAYWLREYPSDSTAVTLIALIDDEAQSIAIRENAVESLGDCHGPRARDAVLRCLFRQLESLHPQLRYWAVWALGGRLRDSRAYSRIEQLIGDSADEGCSWSVGREAQAVCAEQRRGSEYDTRLQAEMKTLIDDPATSAKERKWAEFYWTGDHN